MEDNGIVDLECIGKLKARSSKIKAKKVSP